jgi:hypothetical protein
MTRGRCFDEFRFQFVVAEGALVKAVSVPVLLLSAACLFAFPVQGAAKGRAVDRPAHELLSGASYRWDSNEKAGQGGPDGCPFANPGPDKCGSNGSVRLSTNARGSISTWFFYSFMRKPKTCRDGAWARWTSGGEKPMRVLKNGIIRYRVRNDSGRFRLSARVSKDGRRIAGRYVLKYKIPGYSSVCSSKPVRFVATTTKKP